MSFLKHLLPGWKRTIELKQRANAAILAALDKELTDTERETIKSKVLLALDTSTGEWLDLYGRLFGLLRQDNEEDESYRQRILSYIQLRRGTIPAIKDAVRAFLNDYDTYIDIYEPYTNVFTLNQSKLNGPDHFLGDYYTVAVIDVKIGRPFPVAVMDTINEFKPAGVTVHLTYQPSAYNPDAPIIGSDIEDEDVILPYTQLHMMNGMVDRIRGHLNLTTRTPGVDDESGIFILNSSKLNSDDRLTGSFAVGNPTYNLASYSTDDVVFSTSTTIEKVLENTERLSADFSTKTGDLTDQYAAVSIDNTKDTHLYFTLDVATYFDNEFNSYLREVQPDGVYTSDTYRFLMANTALLYHMKAAVPPMSPSSYYVQVLNLDTGMWDSIGSGKVNYEVTGGKLEIADLYNYLSDTGLIFTRIKLNANTGAQQYNLDLHFFELSFHKEIAVRPTIEMGPLEITGESSLMLAVNGGTMTDRPTDLVDGGDFSGDADTTYDGGSF
jgi:hypothetical protein